MIGVLINSLAVAAGGLLGSRLRGGIPQKYSSAINYALALCVMIIGVSGALAGQSTMLMIVSMVIGTVLGELLRLEDRLESAGNALKARFARGEGDFSTGFISATLLFCVGSMAVIGSLEAGFDNKPDTLLAKSVLDGVASLVFASNWGMGVALSALPLLVYQGGIALLAMLLGHFLPQEAITELSATGSLLILGLGINMLGVSGVRIKVGNMLPAMFIPAIYVCVSGLF